MKSKLIISPRTKVGELLDAYPQLEKILMDMSPMFEKLKNPILRKTIARVATLQQVAAVGGLNAGDIVNRLRKELGMTEAEFEEAGPEFTGSDTPSWLVNGKVTDSFDATPVINSGGSPMAEILRRTAALKTGEIFELHTPFLPAPIIDTLKGKGFSVHTISSEGDFRTFIFKPLNQ
jgi:hypothetical protein